MASAERTRLFNRYFVCHPVDSAHARRSADRHPKRRQFRRQLCQLARCGVQLVHFDRRDERIGMTQALDGRPQLFQIQIGPPRTSNENEVVLVAPALLSKHVPRDGWGKRGQDQVL